MLRHGDEKRSIWLHNLVEVAQGGQIIGNVLQHIEAANDIKLGIIRKIGDVCLAEVRACATSLGDWQCIWVVFQTRYVRFGEILC